ncbi:hypothetical protein CWIS_04710 [Cellulomonas sp. A375-1]|uniref:hypothetical protein n=1 Tax=Cellulomonas sp. A375-1 TaxID=1672219 RepID=UPI000652841F|nr:hypothetical protein [Cellulomonas sp. A375-1]KMM46531.1 hypothetical protein CWIS_04710 [Cellulomonas sp. A375-1]
MSTSDDETARAEAAGRAAGPTSTSEPSSDTARHAVVRPEPTPPPPPPSGARPSTVPAPPPAPSPAPVLASPPDGGTEQPTTGQTPPQATQPAGDQTRADDPALFPSPNAPHRTATGTHVLGALAGLLLAPLAVTVLLLGQSRILAVQVVGWDDAVDWSGVVLVVLALVALGWVALLAVWTPAAPITGGVVLTVLGAVALTAPHVVHAQVLRVVDESSWRSTALEVTVAGTSGTLLVAGFLLLLAGVVALAAHRRGLALGAFRERHR